MDSIQLLNGELFRQDEILELMKDDEFYYGYLGKAALSSSSIKLLLDSPKKYKYVTEYGSQESNALDAGYLFHVESVTRRFDRPRPSPHIIKDKAFLTPS